MKKQEGRRLKAGAREFAQQKTIQNKTPDQIKLPFTLWTRRAIQTLIQDRYKLKMPIRSMGECLRGRGYTPQKPIKCQQSRNGSICVLGRRDEFCYLYKIHPPVNKVSFEKSIFDSG